MSQGETDAILAELSAGQWGLFTTKQAADRGIGGMALARSELSGRIERLAQGAYRQASVPPSPLDDLRAAWLLTRPALTAEERLENHDVVVGYATAAFLHDIGDFVPEPYVFLSSSRRQTRRHDIAFRHRQIDARDVRLIDGLPTTSIERTIADLLSDRQDDSLVADVLRDATRSGRDVDETRIIELLDEQSAWQGRGDGRAIYENLAVLAGIDEVSTVVKAFTSPIAGLLLSTAFALQLDEILGPLREALASGDGKAALATIGRVVDNYRAPELGAAVNPDIQKPKAPATANAAVRTIQDTIRRASEASRLSGDHAAVH